MTARDRRVLQAYLNDVKERLGLRDWQVELSKLEPDTEGWVASCYTIPGRRVAIVRVRNDFRDHDAVWQRSTIVHELLHAVHAQTQDLVRIVLGNAMEDEQHTIFCECWFQAHELAIDTLAEALAPSFPPIRWPR